MKIRCSWPASKTDRYVRPSCFMFPLACDKVQCADYEEVKWKVKNVSNDWVFLVDSTMNQGFSRWCRITVNEPQVKFNIKKARQYGEDKD